MGLLSVDLVREHTLTVIKLFQSSADDELLGAEEGTECWGRRERLVVKELCPDLTLEGKQGSQ